MEASPSAKDRSVAKDRPRSLPVRAGVGLKSEHFDDIVTSTPDVGFFEIHAENFMGAGGPPHAQLTRIRQDYPLSVHGVGLSIGGAQPLDRAHLDRLKTLIDRYQPESFSEHLAWSTHGANYLNDLLPIPYTNQTLKRVVSHINQLQDKLQQRILLENPATYLGYQASSYSEIDFLHEVVRQTGCGLLLDVNNVYVCAVNHGFAADDYIDAFPMAHVDEIHLAGFATDYDDLGETLLIDAHCAPVSASVWKLYEHALARRGPIPTLIEWDNEAPAWPALQAEAERAEALLRKCGATGQSALSAGVAHDVDV
ncbi:DUF692 domain-containing protein [Methylocystis sp. FS]|uniref:MNIO family bufferin maturase n=1 Tax=Methylocystis silviterrae TaxID=2743612 RepID=UPI001581ABA2|nr:DUF692 domain-containing protein [Methylocystis silviterrae]NUJ81360.1 DUF692 domain-containing protein [Methylocystis silviterrae]